jgi:uncharacterized protein (TIGR02145 family)
MNYCPSGYFIVSDGGGPSSSSNGGQGGGGYTGSYGSVPYEGKTYKTVQIGTQTWFAENLNIDIIVSSNTEGRKCYDNDPNNCTKYGRLYDWSTAMGLDPSCNSNYCEELIQPKHQGICPSGWHIPSDDDWNVLMNYVGGSSTAGTKLKATSGWNSNGNGTDQYGFSALPGGYGGSDGYFYYAGYNGFWWSASEDNSNYAYSRYMNYNNEGAHWDISNKSLLFSVRCLQD